MTKEISLATLASMAGAEVGVSDWLLIDQERVNRFAEVTGDHQFIHVDPEAARQTPFGGTIAHGFLTLSLMSQCVFELVPPITGVQSLVNYGLNKVRFLMPVRVGKRCRLRLTLAELAEKEPGRWLARFEAVMEIEGEDRPAYVADFLSMLVMG